MKDDFSQKNYTGIYFFRMFWKDGLFKKDRAGIWSFLYYLETWYCFPENMVFFLWMENERDDLSQEIHGNMIFSIYYLSRPPYQKNQIWSYSAKIHLTVIDILDRHPRKSSSNSLYLHGGLYRYFDILLSSKKKIGNLMHRIEVWFLLQFIWLEIFYNE